MEWWKLFSGTFILIFLAELGDKTQLAALAKTADSPNSSTAKWVVFLGASLALAASTFIAVFLGNTLKAWVPDERYIKIAAGSLFLIFGSMILYETYQSFRGVPAATAAPASSRVSARLEGKPGLVGGLALRAAMDFESSGGERYRRLAASAPSWLSDLLSTLASEEDGHLARLRNLPEKEKAATAAPSSQLNRVSETRQLNDPRSPDTVRELIRHEEATADFYQYLANRTLIPAAREVFATLAEEEKNHAERLTEALRKHEGNA